MGQKKIHFTASRAASAQEALTVLSAQYGSVPLPDAEVIVALGGDGFMLETLQGTEEINCPVYGMNRGTVGFLMNEYAEDDLLARLDAAEDTIIHPLHMSAETDEGGAVVDLAINEVSLLRAGPQAAKLRIIIDGRVRLEELVCDGVLLSTPAGSTAYNYSAHGPILPVGSEVLALTPMAAYRPRRWRGAILPQAAKVRFEIIEPEKRPVSATADGKGACIIRAVDIETHFDLTHRILFDPGHGLEERLIREQFI
ncbi:MAG: NAD kinase [Pseudomonadota bacterium]